MACLQDELLCLCRYMHPGYCIVGDNADMQTHAQHQRPQYTDLDAHMFQLAAYKNRVSANHLDPSQPIANIKTAPFSTILPSLDDLYKLLSKLAFHIADT